MEVLFFLFLVLIVFPRTCIKGYKQGKEEFNERKSDEWRSLFSFWEGKYTLSAQEEDYISRRIYSDYKKEIDDLYFLYPSLKDPPAKSKTLKSLLLSQMGKITRMNALFMHGGLKYQDYRDEISYELFITFVFHIDRNLRKHGMNEPLLAYKKEEVKVYDNFKRRYYYQTNVYVYEVSEKDRSSIITRKEFERFLWKPQLPYTDLDKIEDYPY